ncbi:MAG TPA: phosphoribosylformylglycinamidine cyclo-ligase [Treponemataceae bacterium]|nr:phosphoribosylformylglycinamidine cyclo-ligase [Treponemataceae bacterium]
MIDYRQSGVDVEEGYRAVDNYKASAKRTMIPGVLNGLGSFAGLFEMPSGYKEPVIVSGTDGVGTKLDIAFQMKKYDTVGIDCVAMCVNDVLCHGARPLFFLDYLACGKLDADVAGAMVKGVADGCLQAASALMGGETAEMPGFYDAGKYDIAGFSVGVVEKSKIIDGSAIREGDALIGLASSGVHSNGFSLVRKLVTNVNDDFNGKPIGETLLTPTKIYVKPVLALLEKIAIHGMVHITGGGFYENVPRMYPTGGVHGDAKGARLVSVIKKGSWPVLPIFDELVRRGANPDRMYHTFNMGIGFILAVAKSDAKEAIAFLNKEGFPAYEIGHVGVGTEDVSFV